PQVAIVMPQSLQLSVFNSMALDAQKASVRALYQYARGEAYAVGEYQTDRLGNPKLIILPSPLALDSTAWEDILTKVRNGSVLLVTGPFDRDAHFHPAGRREEIALPYEDAILSIRESVLQWPEGQARLTFGGDRTTFLDRAVLPGNATWAEQTIGNVYRYAMKVAGVTPTYSAAVNDPGMLISPTQFPHATLYVLTSESTGREVSFRDQKSNKEFSAHLDPGRAALLLVGGDGAILASYNWPGANAAKEIIHELR